jgi:hypothetical protein
VISGHLRRSQNRPRSQTQDRSDLADNWQGPAHRFPAHGILEAPWSF